jgi:hypothetical protein
MIEVKVPMNEDDFDILKVQADASHLSVEEYTRLRLHNTLAKETSDFEKIVEYVTNKNAELYGRFASGQPQ